MPVKCEKATPLGIVQPIVAAVASAINPKYRFISNLVQLKFYLCLSSCKYTKCMGHRRTVQFRTLLKLVFFYGDQILQADATIEHSQYATQIILTLDNHTCWGSA